MPKGFFPLTVLSNTRKPDSIYPRCDKCGLKDTCDSPKMPPRGKFRKEILVVGEAPGREEDDQNRQFVGKAGRKLRAVLNQVGLDLDRDCRVTNALICRPPGNKIRDKRAIEYCRPNLLNEIKEYKPKVIILLGQVPVKSLIGWLWKENVGTMTRWAGWTIPSQRLNAWICPTYHPSYLLREGSPVLDRMFEDHLRKAASLEGRPWRKIPDYKSQVQPIFDLDEAAKAILKFCSSKKPVAFDFEANMLKPDTDKFRIVCCSLSDGKTTIAFPWHGPVIRAMRRFIRSDVPKIASNMKYEDRVVNAKLGIKVKRWRSDTMLKSHVLDNRAEIASIKFQSFVRLGQESYDDRLKPYLRTKGGGYTENRIGEVDLTDLLIYCGLDSLLEVLVANNQEQEITG